jgi:hypothetical protein
MSNYNALYQVLSDPSSWSGNDISVEECVEVLSTLISDLLYNSKKPEGNVNCLLSGNPAAVIVRTDSVHIYYNDKHGKPHRISVGRIH